MDGLRVSEHASESGCWRISSLAPIGPTGLHVSAFHAYEERGTAFRRRRELPDGSAVLIFNHGKELRVVDRAGVHAVGEGDGFFSGASATYVITETDGAQMGAQAHMIHDFQEFAGSPPAALWRRELPDAGGFVD